jgi:GNAT superfamily N-acetyltransferase
MMRPIRSLTANDLPAVKAVIASTELFPPELLDDMAAPFLAGGDGAESWLVVEDDGRLLAVAYVTPERMTSGTANLLLIAVHRSEHGRGIGRELIAEVERRRAEAGDRILLVETSGLPEFARTRQFYLVNGYEQEAVIRDFYQAGEDKVVFRKLLAA